MGWTWLNRNRVFMLQTLLYVAHFFFCKLHICSPDPGLQEYFCHVAQHWSRRTSKACWPRVSNSPPHTLFEVLSRPTNVLLSGTLLPLGVRWSWKLRCTHGCKQHQRIQRENGRCKRYDSPWYAHGVNTWHGFQTTISPMITPFGSWNPGNTTRWGPVINGARKPLYPYQWVTGIGVHPTIHPVHIQWSPSIQVAHAQGWKLLDAHGQCQPPQANLSFWVY